ncbi:MAG: hypothetical protein Q8936_19655 [Bacillota bacterium]|nr:hypothetical protein [Bacillota bacterium]
MKTKDMVLVAIFAALTAVVSMLSIRLIPIMKKAGFYAGKKKLEGTVGGL